MKEIPLTRGQVALIDDADFNELSRYKWCVMRIYACRFEGRRCIPMHRQILQAPAELEVDHIDGNGLNNQRSNLRLCTTSQNQQNSRRRTDNTSGYKGVSFDQRRGRWKAQIRVNGKRITLGRYDDIEHAAAAYHEAALRYHGEFARFV